jgi:hypothetical protein
MIDAQVRLRVSPSLVVRLDELSPHAVDALHRAVVGLTARLRYKEP